MRVIGKFLIGSQNYHLDGPQSDRDYKVLIAPEFIDLYRMKEASKGNLPFGYDPQYNSAMDVRKFDSLLRQGNVNAIEQLFSSEFNIFDTVFEKYFNLAREAYSKGYVAYVWQNYFASAKGLVLNSIRRYDNSDANRRKANSRALFMTNFILHVATNNFCINEEVWNNPAVYKAAREYRFNEQMPTFYKEDIYSACFDELERIALQYLEFFLNDKVMSLKQYENELQLCMQNLIADAIKEELEAR